MSDNRRKAAMLLKVAADTILRDRPSVHGSAENSFEMIGDMWTVYLRHVRRVRGRDSVLPEDVAEMMAMLKKCRKVYGDVLNEDNDVDDIGYTALSGMLRLPDPDKAADLDGQIEQELGKIDVEQEADPKNAISDPDPSAIARAIAGITGSVKRDA